MQSNQAKLDEALAAFLQQEEEEEARKMFLITDEEVAKEWQHMEDSLISVSDDERYAKSLQEQEYMTNHVALTDDVIYQFQELDVSRSTSHHGDTSQHQQSHVGSSSNASSHSFHDLPPNVDDIDTDNMTYEELNELGQSMGAVNKGLSKRRIDQLPTHKFGATKWFRMKFRSSEKSQCPICLIEFKEGDTLSTLPCAHIYHKECISLWLEENKICCVCTAEVKP